MARTYSSSDLKNSSKVGKRFLSFQYIEGRGAINLMNSDAPFATAYLCSILGNIMAMSKIDGTPEDAAENIKNMILDYYKSNVDSIESKKES